MTSQTNTASVRPRRGAVRWKNLNQPVILAISALHLLALGALWPGLFSWSGLILFAVLAWISGGLGITLGFHRLLTHRSFRTPRWLEYALTLCGCLAWQGGPVEWVGTHRLHHKHSDRDHDPHSPSHGFTWSHILWTLHRDLDGIQPRLAAKDLIRDPIMNRIDRSFFVPQLVLAAVLLGAGWAIGGPRLGAGWVVWGVALRTVVVFHVTWFVNSAAHTWGYRNYPDTGECSTNLWWVALLGFGEGWHNNHHAHPRSAAHGLRWFEVDVTWWTIRALSWAGLAWDIKRPKPSDLPRRRAKRRGAAEAAGPSPISNDASAGGVG